MVCQSTTGDGTVPVTVRNTIAVDGKRSMTIHLSFDKTVKSIFQEVSQEFGLNPEMIELMMQNNKTGDVVVLNQYIENQVGDCVSNLFDEYRFAITVSEVRNKKMNLAVSSPKSNSEEELPLGSSASPVENSEFGPNVRLVLDFPNQSNTTMCEEKPAADASNYVGLVNQAMTCYLNSLIQALYMTPEFRNALYNWEFHYSNSESEEERSNSESKSIPFQLQKLFLNLQTSSKSAVETTELTSSFGWDLQAAWEQHDIQELCRVMFEALEQKFKDTKQANLINDLYEGKMLDYVKCLECSTEKSREDTFLDIPLPVKPFGSPIAYNSIEEALRAFVQPETLDGVNQYHCEKCNKKCDAHKGLKFIKFPYLLTLHLKRFDFDYSTMHRIKLNDKVVFPKVLNLNSFIPGALDVGENYEEHEAAIKGDDCSTTDSGSALDDESCQGMEASSTINGQEEPCQDDDEGIDVSNNHENEKNRLQEQKGPYCYELFSIMIHSGSASGGHYYAYIKDFLKDQWFCFNDQSVSTITEDDIRKSYGGGPQRGYYSGAYTSSTNAYMLMYRQIDKERNAKAMTTEDFPPHITKLLQQMRENEERVRLNREKENDMFKMKVHCYHPLRRTMIETKLYVHIDQLFSHAISQAHKQLKLVDVCNLEDCRIVSYNKNTECIKCSFEGEDFQCASIARMSLYTYNDYLLEIKEPGTSFQVHKLGGGNVKVFVVNVITEEIDNTANLRVNVGESLFDFKLLLAKKLNLSETSMYIVEEGYNGPKYLDDNVSEFRFESCARYFVSSMLDEDPDKTFENSKLKTLVENLVVISIDVLIPDTDVGSLEALSIPSLDLNQNLDRIEMEHTTNSPSMRVSPQPSSIMSNEFIGDQSNSEDSSLSDSDRTLVGDAPGDCLGLLSSSSNSPLDQHMASPLDTMEDNFNNDYIGKDLDAVHWSEEDVLLDPAKNPNYYFKASLIPDFIYTDNYGGDSDTKRCCAVILDKRMDLGKFKKHMEPVLGVPSEYFKVYRHYGSNDVEWSTLSETFRLRKDQEKLTIKLGRVLKKDEFLGKVYLLTPDGLENFKLLFEWIVGKGQLVGQVKKEILTAAKKQHMLEIAFNKCRLRKKIWKDPAKIYLDDQRFVDDVSITNNFEILLQELPDGEKATCTRSLALFVRQWSPSTFSLSPYHEVVLDNRTIEGLKKKLEEASNIPAEFIEVAYVKHPFPCDINVLSVHRELDWNPTVTHLEEIQVDDDGMMFFYRDSREVLKEISSEERQEIHQRENARLERFNSTRAYSSPRRERALKIYVDTSPNKGDDAGID